MYSLNDVGAGLAPARRSRRGNEFVQRRAGASPAPTDTHPETALILFLRLVYSHTRDASLRSA